MEKRKESVIELIQRLRKKFKTPEWQARKREENIIHEWKHGPKRTSKTSDGSKEFKLPKD